MELTTHDNALVNLAKATAALGGSVKPILKYKKGVWKVGADDEQVPLGTQLAANVLDARMGWIRWDNDAPPERRMVPMTSGMAPPLRETLGHLDQDLWESDDQGRPVDPWQKVFEFPVRELDGELREFLISGSSNGFERAFKAFLSAACRQFPANAGKVPIVELGSGSFKHRKWGDVLMPTLTIVRWVKAEDLPGVGCGGDAGGGDGFNDELDDDIPF